MKAFAVWFVTLACFLVFASGAFADVPYLVNYQGIVTDTGGTPITGTHSLLFRIYPDSLSATSPIWTEYHDAVEIDEGLFNVILGGISPIPPDLFNAEERWLGIRVNHDPEMYPRIRITSVPWAIRAAIADSALTTSGGGTGDGHSLDAADGDPVDVVYVDNEGQVGVGTTSPTSKLHVLTTAAAERAGYFHVNNAGNNYNALYAYTNGTSQAIRGEHGENFGYLGSVNYGVVGHHVDGAFGYLGGEHGAFGQNEDNLNWGALGLWDYGVQGHHESSGNEGYIAGDSYAVYGTHNSSSNTGYIGGSTAGVYGRYNTGNNEGWLGRSDCGVEGFHNASYNSGKLATDSYGVYGEHGSSGNYGYVGGDTAAVYGSSSNDYGVYGHSDWSVGVRGGSVNGSGVNGVNSTSNNQGSLGTEFYGVSGTHASSNNTGHIGGSGAGAYGYSSTGYGVHGESSTGYAGYFTGNVHITGHLSKGTGTFLIDHPLDPENKVLRHSFVESPENLLIYRGKVGLDESGEAIVELPDYFKALAKEDEATVTLTSVGRPFLTGYEWVSGYVSFRLYGEPNREVSWVVYADRDDPVIHQLAQPVEEEKGPESKVCDKGELIYPTAYGYSEEKGRDYKRPHKKKRLEQEPAGELAKK